MDPIAPVGDACTTGVVALVADDDPILREIAASKLEALGMKVSTAVDGLDAWAKLEAEVPGILFLDLSMPGLDGFEVIRRARADERLLHLPIVVITGREDVDAVEQAFALGATSFLTKPLNWSLFAHQVRFVLRAATTEAELRTARAAEQVASQMKADFLAVVTHELRTPVHVISGFADLLQREIDGPIGRPSYRGYVGEIGRATDDLDTILTDMLTFTRVTAGRLEMTTEEWEATRVAKDVMDRFEPAARAKGVLLEAVVDPDLLVDCDRKLTVRALCAFVDNAVKFTPAGGRVTLSAALADGVAEFTVRDDGPGLSPDQIPSLFKPFRQADMSLARPSNGLGLGLAITAAVAMAHGGSARLENLAGGGAIATLRLPAATACTLNPEVAAAE